MGAALSGEARELHRLALQGELREAGRLVKKSARRDELLAEQDGQGRIALQVAAGSKQADVGTLRRDKVVKLLVDFGSEVNHADARGWTALHYACSIGAVETAALLLERGGDPLARDLQGLTPLQVMSSQVQGQEPINTFDNDDGREADLQDHDDDAGVDVAADSGERESTPLRGEPRKRTSSSSASESRANLLRIPRALLQEARPLFAKRLTHTKWASKVQLELTRDPQAPRERVECIVHFPSDNVLEQALDQLDFVQVMTVRQRPWNLAPLLTRFKRIANCKFHVDHELTPRAVASFAAADLLAGFHSFRIVYVCGEMSETPEAILAASDVFHIEGDYGLAFDKQSCDRPEPPARKTKKASSAPLAQTTAPAALDIDARPATAVGAAASAPIDPRQGREDQNGTAAADPAVGARGNASRAAAAAEGPPGHHLEDDEDEYTTGVDEDDEAHDGDYAEETEIGHRDGETAPPRGLVENEHENLADYADYEDDEDEDGDEYDGPSMPDLEEEWDLIKSEYTCMHGAPWHANELPNERMSEIHQLLLRDRILALSRDQDIWKSRWTKLVDPPPEDFELSIAAVQYQAKCALELDPNLEKARLAFVPGKIKELDFWRAYFWHVELIKLDLINMLNSGVPQKKLDDMVAELPPLDPTPPGAYFIPIPLPPISQVALLRHYNNVKLEALESVSANDRVKYQAGVSDAVTAHAEKNAESKRVQFLLDL